MSNRSYYCQITVSQFGCYARAWVYLGGARDSTY